MTKKDDKNRIGKETVWVKASDLIDEAVYQRSRFVSKTIKAITERFDEALFDPIKVAVKADGKMHVMDGRHRLEGLRLLGKNDMLVQCIVNYHLSLPREAEVFWRGQSQRASLNTIELYRAKVIAKEPIEVAIHHQLTDLGVEVVSSGLKNPGDGSPIGNRSKQMQAIGTYKELYVGFGEPLMSKVVTTILEAWPEQHGRFVSMVLKGLTWFCASNDGHIDTDRLVATLAATTPAKLIEDAVANRGAGRWPVPAYIALGIEGAYNHRKKVGRLSEKPLVVYAGALRAWRQTNAANAG